jgi:hypothetical protein
MCLCVPMSLSDSLRAMQDETPRSKLDMLMLKSFEFITLKFEEDAIAMFEALWSDFERVILNTYQCHYVQFLLFYASRSLPTSLSPLLTRIMSANLFY